MADAHVLPEIGILLPEGWARLRFDETIDEQVAGIVSVILQGVAEPQRRDVARIALRRGFADIVAKAGASAYEVWMPVATTGGVTIPLTVTVGPAPGALDPSRTVAEHLTAFAASSPESRLCTVGGRPAVRIAADRPGERNEQGEWTAFPRRRVTAVVSPGADGGEWLVFLAEIVVPQEDADEIVSACEFFVDAFLATVHFPPDQRDV